jgi:hypothetical protein
MRRLLTLTLIVLALFGAPTTTLRTALAQNSNTAPGKPDVKVWVNTSSGVYHCPGTRWYGNTKAGEYMTQKDAQGKGYRAAYGKPCQ